MRGVRRQTGAGRWAGIDVANVVWCTGFRPTSAGSACRSVDGNAVQSAACFGPGLYSLGLLFQYSFTSMLVRGAGRDAAYVVDRIADRLAAGARASSAVAATA